MGKVCSSKDSNEAKVQNTNGNKNRMGYVPSNRGEQVSRPQQMPAQNDGYQKNGFQNMDFQRGGNNMGSRNPGYNTYRSAPPPGTNQNYPMRANNMGNGNPDYNAYQNASPGKNENYPVRANNMGNGNPDYNAHQTAPPRGTNQNYPVRGNNMGNGNPDYNAYQAAPRPPDTNQNYPMNRQENVAARPGHQVRGLPNSGFQRNAGMTDHSNPHAVTYGGYQDGGYQNQKVMNQRRDMTSYAAQTAARFLPGNQNVGYQSNEMQFQDAPNQMNPAKRPEPKFDAGIGDMAGNYQADNTQVVKDGTIYHESRNYQEDSAAMTGAYDHNDLNTVGHKAIGSGMAVSPPASSCNCEVIDPTARGGIGLGVKVYDPLVKAFVYEVDHFPLNGMGGSTLQPKGGNPTQPVIVKQPLAVNQTDPNQSKYGVITSP